MYGLVNSALQDMIVTHFGEDTWSRVREHAGVPDEVFLAMRRYDDSITYDIAGAAATLLNAPIDDCMEMFGRHWVSAIAAKNFATLMDATGNDTLSFLRNVNALHDRITSTFLDYIPPQFQLDDVDPQNGLYHVHYYSHRKGLSHFVTGLLNGLANHFDDNLDIISIAIDDDGEGTHSVFKLSIQ